MQRFYKNPNESFQDRIQRAMRDGELPKDARIVFEVGSTKKPTPAMYVRVGIAFDGVEEFSIVTPRKPY